MMRRIATFLLLCFTSVAQDSANLDEIVKPFSAAHKFMGAVLVTEGDRTLLNKGYGMADLEWNLPNAPDVKFRLGSLTKQFTAALVLLVQEDGKLSINDPVRKHLPDAPKAWDKITLFQLLSHTSGIPDFTGFKTFDRWSMSAHTHSEELAFFSNHPLDFEPGAKYAYSNSNYAVLGFILETVTGQKYETLLRSRILQPLGMNDTGVDADSLILPKRAHGYRIRNGEVEYARSESMSVPWAAGSMYSTTGDLLRWEQALFGGKVLKPESLKAMTTPGKGNYGLGVSIVKRRRVDIVQHDGGIEGFDTFLAYAPERKIAVIVLCNVNGNASDALGIKLMNALL